MSVFGLARKAGSFQWHHVRNGHRHRWAGNLLRRKDDKWSLYVTEWLPSVDKRLLGRRPMGILILKIFQRPESASLDASSERSSGLDELWFH
ncbi:unnamed protein product [Heligmosomoides polygyrus]|uniref:Uncharacterized protein n=1 Tax=Heligmosomoides polygyrus TaxID=6339 RepID=A0A183G565_HELPZ|nr:unnamed protein product [Heligmosomoides polygyrus]